MAKVLRGVVHGRTIELLDDIGIADGREVEVHVRVVAPSREWGGGILRTAGALADDQEWDAIMEEIYQARKVGRRPQTDDE
jgi:hypothetical protein